MELCTTYQNTHHQLMVVIGSQWSKTCWPFRFKLMSNINPAKTSLLTEVFSVGNHPMSSYLHRKVDNDAYIEMGEFFEVLFGKSFKTVKAWPSSCYM